MVPIPHITSAELSASSSRQPLIHDHDLYDVYDVYDGNYVRQHDRCKFITP